MIYSSFLAEGAKILRTSSAEVERIIITAPYRYKHYTIPKRNGGVRDIHHPSPALKALQRWVSSEILNVLPVHESVFSYRKGTNISMHANAHIQSNYFTRYDFSNFFPSINGQVLRDFLSYSKQSGILDMDFRTIDAIVRIACRINKNSNRLVLSIGAPSSPHISNALLFNFDNHMWALSKALHGVYSRYADDVYLSARTKQAVAALEQEFQKQTATCLPFLQINQQKTQHLSRRRRVSVTGVNITPQRQLSIGRDLKRSIKTRIFLALQSQLLIEELSSLRGMLAHIRSVEPAFIDSLSKKFGYEALGRILDPHELSAPEERLSQRD